MDTNETAYFYREDGQNMPLSAEAINTCLCHVSVKPQISFSPKPQGQTQRQRKCQQQVLPTTSRP